MKRVASLLVAVLVLSQAAHAAESGRSLDGLEAFDRTVQELLDRWSIPGASLAVAKDGRLVLAKGYGYADRDAKTPVTPETLFRTGSINKTVTAVAVLKLVEVKKLALDDPVLPILAKASLVPGRLGDPRAKSITVRQLLNHSAGFDRTVSGDPFFQPRLVEVARRQRVAPVTCEAIIVDSLERKLDFSPGGRHAYSNLGYCMLGKIVEVVTGESYRSYVSRELLRPSTGKDFLAGKSIEALPGEVKYYSNEATSRITPAPGIAGSLGVPAPYGSYSIESMEALGAWVATPGDVLKFFLAIDGARGTRLLSAESIRLMREEPTFTSGERTAGKAYYALGISVNRAASGDNWWHTGSQPGVQTLALRTRQGYAWAIAFNSRPADRSAFIREFDRALWNAARSVSRWPDGDLAGPGSR
jgi:CubicO group peptidase (beta-lactamase class C family)